MKSDPALAAEGLDGPPQAVDIQVLSFEASPEESISGLQRVFSLDREAAVQLVMDVPATVKRGVPRDEAGPFVTALERIGARVRLARVGTPAPYLPPLGSRSRPAPPRQEVSSARPLRPLVMARQADDFVTPSVAPEMPQSIPPLDPGRAHAEQPSSSESGAVAGGASSVAWGALDSAKLGAPGALPPVPRLPDFTATGGAPLRAPLPLRLGRSEALPPGSTGAGASGSRELERGRKHGGLIDTRAPLPVSARPQGRTPGAKRDSYWASRSRASARRNPSQPSTSAPGRSQAEAHLASERARERALGEPIPVVRSVGALVARAAVAAVILLWAGHAGNSVFFGEASVSWMLTQAFAFYIVLSAVFGARA